MSQIFTPDSKTYLYHFFQASFGKGFLPLVHSGKTTPISTLVGIMFLNFIGIVALILNAGGVIDIQWYFGALASESFSKTETIGVCPRRDCVDG